MSRDRSACVAPSSERVCISQVCMCLYVLVCLCLCLYLTLPSSPTKSRLAFSLPFLRKSLALKFGVLLGLRKYRCCATQTQRDTYTKHRRTTHNTQHSTHTHTHTHTHTQPEPHRQTQRTTTCIRRGALTSALRRRPSPRRTSRPTPRGATWRAPPQSHRQSHSTAYYRMRPVGRVSGSRKNSAGNCLVSGVCVCVCVCLCVHRCVMQRDALGMQ